MVVVLLTLLTQIGGFAWLVALSFRRRILAFFVTYVALSLTTIWIAPQFGRVALDCFSDGPLKMQSGLYCMLNRHYVSPELREVLVETAVEMDRLYPGTETLVLDANFPFLDGFPLLPHLSHDDGEKADLAFYYSDETGYLGGATRSPLGYFAFEKGDTNCQPEWPSLRWDLGVLQPYWHDYEIEEERLNAVLRLLSDNPRVQKIFVEPHLTKRLGIKHPKIRFQGCRAARHDDHIHFQL